MIQLGDNTFPLEGKAINGFNNDRVRKKTLPSSVGCDLFAENIYRDFAMNAMWYDPFNQIIIDPTGHGVEDSLTKVLRIPVQRKLWDRWLEGNPTKLYRYWKFRARGYIPADQETKAYVAEKAPIIAKSSWDDWDCKIMLQKGVMDSKNDSVAKLKMKAFKDAIIEDLGVDFYNTYFLKHEPK